MKLTAQQVFDKLINEDGILTQKGQIIFYFGDLEVLVKKKDVVGNIMQEWVESWLKKNNIEYSVNSNTQTPPDFYLSPPDEKHGLLEVKAFNYEGSNPAFDIANFTAFTTGVLEKPYMLDVDYLIFGYTMKDGVVRVNKVWLKKIWEISSPSDKWGVKVQEKKKIIYTLRPAKWYGKKITYPIFRSLDDYISALDDTVQNYFDRTNPARNRWLDRLIAKYKEESNVRLTKQRWDDICGQYCWSAIKKEKKEKTD